MKTTELINVMATAVEHATTSAPDRDWEGFTCYAPGHDWKAEPLSGLVATGRFHWPYDDLEGYSARADETERDVARHLGHSDFVFVIGDVG